MRLQDSEHGHRQTQVVGEESLMVRTHQPNSGRAYIRQRSRGSGTVEMQ